MATIIYKLTGGTNQTAEASTLGELKQKLNLVNYLAAVKHGDSVTTQSSNEFQLVDGMVLTFTEQVKGA